MITSPWFETGEGLGNDCLFSGPVHTISIQQDTHCYSYIVTMGERTARYAKASPVNLFYLHGISSTILEAEWATGQRLSYSRNVGTSYKKQVCHIANIPDYR